MEGGKKVLFSVLYLSSIFPAGGRTSLYPMFSSSQLYSLKDETLALQSYLTYMTPASKQARYNLFPSIKLELRK